MTRPTKPFDSGLEESLRMALNGAFPDGPAIREGRQFAIWRVSGFELFNTRPYHNYETWSHGYHATDGRVFAMAEDFGECLRRLMAARLLPDDALKTYQRATPEMAAFIAPPKP